MIKAHPAYRYAQKVLKGEVKAPKYVILQCTEFIQVANGKSRKYIIDEDKLDQIMRLLRLLVMPKGLKAYQTVAEALAGFQWLFIVAVLCTVYRSNRAKRRYQTAILEICRKNGKTFLVAVLFILLLLTEPKFSKFYSVAPDGSLSREVKTAIEEIIRSSPALMGKLKGKDKFKILRDSIVCNVQENTYFPLNYSTSRLDGKLPSVFLADEVGALPNAYALEAMRSGQLTILNKLGCIPTTAFDWLNSPNLALPAVVIAAVWRQLPYMMVMLLAGLQSVDKSQLEAARIDGATFMQTLRHVTLPTIRPVVLSSVWIAIMNNFQMYTIINLMTGGGPSEATYTLSIAAYEKAFTDYNFGQGAAIGVMWLVFLTIVTVIINKISAKSAENL